jgi:hypothetical protein
LEFAGKTAYLIGACQKEIVHSPSRYIPSLLSTTEQLYEQSTNGDIDV